MTDPNQGITTYTYDGVNNLLQTLLPNGVTEVREYNTVNPLELIKNIKVDATSGLPTILTSSDYTLDKVGNRLSVTDQTGRVVNYVYDPLYRLTQEKITGTGGDRTTDYLYDNMGNRLSKIDSVEGTTTYTCNQMGGLLRRYRKGRPALVRGHLD